MIPSAPLQFPGANGFTKRMVPFLVAQKYIPTFNWLQNIEVESGSKENVQPLHEQSWIDILQLEATTAEHIYVHCLSANHHSTHEVYQFRPLFGLAKLQYVKLGKETLHCCITYSSNTDNHTPQIKPSLHPGVIWWPCCPSSKAT